jgi:hypothetical protein
MITNLSENDLPGILKKITDGWDTCYCPSCHNRENSQYGPSDIPNFLKCNICGWEGHFEDLKSIDEIRNVERTKLIDKILN